MEIVVTATGIKVICHAAVVSLAASGTIIGTVLLHKTLQKLRARRAFNMPENLKRIDN
ncbi:MAG TPA: hypothetical protein GX532_07185 [Clostridia bacterium]|jgi:hypothetical protein|nr:hypothetical protein [Clostridia bacterium]HHY06738.1 hypothetical protein [Clostridia bacterium]